MAGDRVIVVGAGIGGLVAALELAHQGLQVTLLERADTPGGKLRELGEGPARGDAGPTVFTLRAVFDELLDAVGESLDTQLPLAPLEVLARHAWPGGATLDLFGERERSAAAIGEFAGAAEARAYRRFCDRAAGVWAALEQPFVRSPRPNPLSLVWRGGWRGLPGLLRIAPFRTLWSALGDDFRDPRLRQLFGRYATYCGASPFTCPATLMLVAHVERVGVWRVAGGMRAIVEMLLRLARRRGAQLRCGASVERLHLERGRIAAVELSGGERIAADAVVFNGDAAALATGLLGEALRMAAPAPRQRSLSALTWNLAACAEGVPLQHHNVFFGPDYAAEFDALFRRGALPARPTVYVCAPGHEQAADGRAQALFCLVNAPARGDAGAPQPEEIERCEQQTFRQLADCGLRLQPSTRSWRTTPTDFADLFPGTGGALYGEASHGWQASFRRATQRTRIPGLVLAGGSTHPGPGVPMAALSGRLAAAEVLAQLRARRASIAPSRPAVMPGGTSTR